MDELLERRVVSKVAWRLLPLIMLIYFAAYVDRTNVSFASFGMTRQFGFSAHLYGWAAGIFFLGYIIFEIPSNLLMARAGGRRWIARIMITWGIVACATALTAGPASFLFFRFMLGVAEAGFFPGMILYLTLWFPRAYRARVLSVLYVAVPASNAVTAVVSGAILELNGAWGIPGWKWLFVLEGIPAILLGFVVLGWLTDRPARARWLAPEERAWLQETIDRQDQAVAQAHGRPTALQALGNPRVLSLAAMYLTSLMAVYGITFFMPLILKGLGGSDLHTGLLTALPYVVGTIGLVAWSVSSDRTGERKWHFILASLLGAAGLAGAGLLGNSYLALGAMSAATIGLYGSKPAFWAMPSEALTGAGAATGIAFINCVGNLGGFIGPYAIGWIKQETNGYAMALYFLAICASASALIAFLTIARSPRRPSVAAARVSGV